MFVCDQNHRNNHVSHLFGTKTVGGKMSYVIRQLITNYNTQFSGGSKGGARDARSPGAQILSISCSFWENLAKSYVGAPPPGELAPPPRGNPGSATAIIVKSK